MKIIKTKLEGVLILETQHFKDKRGWFSESFNHKTFNKLKIKHFVQDNISFNKKKYTFRGLHYQAKPFAQSKLVRVEHGAILDIILDLRVRSKTFLQMIRVRLDDQKRKQVFIPKGLAHGFVTLQPNTKVFYKVDQYYSAKHDQGINVLDKKIALPGLVKNKFHLSQKDKTLPFLNEKY